MHGHVAARTGSRRLITAPAVGNTGLIVKSRMALQAQKPLLAPLQQKIVYTAVRRMAGHAAQHSHRRMLKDKGSTLLNVAGYAGLPIDLCQVIAIQVSVWIVAIRAFHKAFGNSVVLG